MFGKSLSTLSRPSLHLSVFGMGVMQLAVQYILLSTLDHFLLILMSSWEVRIYKLGSHNYVSCVQITFVRA